jgi:hypothetical protein
VLEELLEDVLELRTAEEIQSAPRMVEVIQVLRQEVQRRRVEDEAVAIQEVDREEIDVLL